MYSWWTENLCQTQFNPERAFCQCWPSFNHVTYITYIIMDWNLNLMQFYLFCRLNLSLTWTSMSSVFLHMLAGKLYIVHDLDFNQYTVFLHKFFHVMSMGSRYGSFYSIKHKHQHSPQCIYLISQLWIDGTHLFPYSLANRILYRVVFLPSLHHTLWLPFLKPFPVCQRHHSACSLT